jgi:hypothetical protein
LRITDWKRPKKRLRPAAWRIHYVKAASCVSTSIKCRVREIVE